MKRFTSVILVIIMIISTICLTSCDAIELIFNIYALINGSGDIEVNIPLNPGNSDHKHIEGIIPAIESTCSLQGKTEGKYCLICEEIIFPPQDAPLKEHTYYHDRDSTCNLCGFERNLDCLHENTDIL